MINGQPDLIVILKHLESKLGDLLTLKKLGNIFKRCLNKEKKKEKKKGNH